MNGDFSAIDPSLRPTIRGLRAVIFFRPNNTSAESLCAGVVLKLFDGNVIHKSAIDKSRLSFHNKAAVDSLADIAQVICKSARDHWTAFDSLDKWKPPFEGVSVLNVSRFSSLSTEGALTHALRSNSSLALLTHGAETTERSAAIVQKIRATWRAHSRNAGLTKYLDKSVEFGNGHGAMAIDFWGHHYGCYFTKLSDAPKIGGSSITRALGRLAQLQKLREMSNAPSTQIGLFNELRPKVHELVVVNSKEAPKALWQAEQFADQFELKLRTLTSTQEAAEFVADAELRAA